MTLFDNSKCGTTFANNRNHEREALMKRKRIKHWLGMFTFALSVGSIIGCASATPDPKAEMYAALKKPNNGTAMATFVDNGMADAAFLEALKQAALASEQTVQGVGLDPNTACDTLLYAYKKGKVTIDTNDLLLFHWSPPWWDRAFVDSLIASWHDDPDKLGAALVKASHTGQSQSVAKPLLRKLLATGQARIPDMQQLALGVPLNGSTPLSEAAQRHLTSLIAPYLVIPTYAQLSQWHKDEQRAPIPWTAHTPRHDTYGTPVSEAEWESLKNAFRHKRLTLTPEQTLACAILIGDEAAVKAQLEACARQTPRVIPDVIMRLWCVDWATVEAATKRHSTESQPRVSREILTARHPLLAKALRFAIDNKFEYDAVTLLIGARDAQDTELINVWATNQKQIPDTLFKQAEKDAFAKSCLRTALLANIPAKCDPRTIVTLFKGDTPVVEKYKKIVKTEHGLIACDTPLTTEGGTLLSGNYYLDKEKHILKGALRIPNGETVRINLMDGSLDGADIIVAEDARLELYNGALFPDVLERISINDNLITLSVHLLEIRNRGTVVFDNCSAITTLINHASADVLLRNDSIVGSFGKVAFGHFRYSGKEEDAEWAKQDSKTMLTMIEKYRAKNAFAGIINKGKLTVGSDSLVCSLVNDGEASVENGELIDCVNLPGRTLTMVNAKALSIENSLGATLTFSGICKELLNRGTMTLRKTQFNELTNEADASTELDDCSIVFIDPTPEWGSDAPPPSTKKMRVSKGSGTITNKGRLAFSGQGDYAEAKIHLKPNAVFVGHGLGDPAKVYQGPPLKFDCSSSDLGRILVEGMAPGRFLTSLPAGFFAEEQDGAGDTLKNLVIVKE